MSLNETRNAMRTQFYGAASLDGFLADRDDSLQWLFQFGDPERPTYEAFIARVGAIAMGASTYDWLRKHLATSGEPWPYTQPCWVFTHRDLPRISGAKLTFVHGDVRPVHAAMAAAAQGGNVWIVGGGDLVGQFHDAGLLDDLIVQVTGVLLGAGKPLLPRRIVDPPLRLVGVHDMGRGFVELRYELPRPR